MSARRHPESAGATILAWAVCLAVSWLAMQTVDLAVQVLK